MERRSGWEFGVAALADCRDVVVAQGSREIFIVAARRSGVRCDCRVGGRPATASLAFERGAAAVTLDVHFEDGGVVDEAVDDSDRHCLVREDFAPFAKGLVGGDEELVLFVDDQLEEHAGFGLVFGDVGDVSGRRLNRFWASPLS